MRSRIQELEGLLKLPSLDDKAARRTAFVTAVSALARAANDNEPSPLEGVVPANLAAAVKAAMASSLLDDASLPASTMAVALFELGGALPQGPEKREVGRRVLAMLHEGTVDVFSALAVRMASASRKGLSTSAVRARIALLFASSRSGVNADVLAWAICSQSELAREWVAQGGAGTLSKRRTAARILERAAAVATRRRADGDDEATVLFATDPIARPFARLVMDRDPLVWRHAAAARGLIAGGSTRGWREVTEALEAPIGGGEWRRAAVSIVASTAVDAERGLRKSREILGGAWPAHDRALIGAMAWGLPRVFDTEPEAAEELLRAIMQADGPGSAESIATLLLEGEISDDARARILPLVRTSLQRRAVMPNGDEGDTLYAQALLGELTADAKGSSASVHEQIARAVSTYVERGAREAHAIALTALEAAKTAVASLETQGGDAAPSSTRGSATPFVSSAATLAGGMITIPGSMPALNNPAQSGKRGAALSIRDLDLALLSDGALEDLFTLRSTGDDDPIFGQLADLRDRVGRWVLAQERAGAEARRKDVGLRSRRLVALGHLLDAGVGDPGDYARSARARAFLVEALGVLAARLGTDRQWQVHPAIARAVVASVDALAREGGCAPVDLLLTIASTVHAAPDVDALAAASMQPQIADTLTGYATLLRDIDSFVSPSPASRSSRSLRASGSRSPYAGNKGPIEDLAELSALLARDESGQSDAIRDLFERLARALTAVRGVSARKTLVDEKDATIEPLAAAIEGYGQHDIAARMRVMGDAASQASRGGATPGRLIASLRRLAQPQKVDAAAALATAQAELKLLVPPPIAKLVGEVLARTLNLPHVAVGGPAKSSKSSAHIQIVGLPDELPAWLSQKRTIGGYYVMKPLGSGAQSSVFIAKRSDEKDDPTAERYALKVPDYNAAIAGNISEQQFLQVFRAEASALLGLPPAPNLARFVTFDLGARPKPILVMELIVGPTLDAYIRGAHEASESKLTIGHAMDLLDGVLAGLAEMHRHSIAHLDLKPSNVILRDGRIPTLVDFGLAGRHIRPGCATGPYGAPEIWGVIPDDLDGEPSPLPADIYAFGCVAFEVLTGETLFSADSETAMVSKHITHDGHPPEMDRLKAYPMLMKLLEGTMRKDPRQRLPIERLRAGMKALVPSIKDKNWPLGK